MKTNSWRWAAIVAVPAIILWAYFPMIADMAERWADDPQYSHGYFVPLFAVVLLCLRRKDFRQVETAPSWWGMGLLSVALGLWLAGMVFFFTWFAAISLLFCLAGLAVVLGGWTALRWSWPSIVFLAFMVPLPYRVQNGLGGGLQRIATVASTYALQTLGTSAVREGNIILVNDARIGVVEACSGLGMLVTFFALATAVALLLRTSEWWLRTALVVSAIPVAIVANVIRITATGLLYGAGQDRLAQVLFHDVAGWLMMPLAVAMLLAEVHVLRRLVVTTDREGDKPHFFDLPTPTPSSGRSSTRLNARPVGEPSSSASAGGSI